MTSNIPVLKQQARELIEDHFRRGEFALSPDHMPSTVWLGEAKKIADENDVILETRVDGKTDKALVRLNRGFPKDMIPYSPEAKAWAAERPGWVEDQHVWYDTHSRGC